MDDEELAKRLEGLDLARESRVKRGLKARLLARGPRPEGSRLLPAAATALALAAVFLVLRALPVRQRPTAYLAAPSPKPVPEVFVPIPAETVFEAVPAGRLFDERPVRIDEIFVKPTLKEDS